MKIKTNVFAITLCKHYLYVRLGSHEHGLEAKAAIPGGYCLGSYCRWNWGSASWQLW